jgi:DNA-binding CsgD family transcriptional regulator
MATTVGRDEEITRLAELLEGLARIDVRVWSALDLLAGSDPVLVLLARREDAELALGQARIRRPNRPRAAHSAVHQLPARATVPHRDVDWSLLSEREHQIAHLVGRAMTNRQIANRIERSPHTVNYHLRQIFRKLGVNSRVELASLLRQHEAGRAEPRAARPSSSSPHSVAPRSPAP